MPIALESSTLFGRGVPAACACSSSAGRGSSSQAEAVHLDESEESEWEVQSSLRGSFNTMNALQEVLPPRREASKINNTKSSSLANAADVVLSPQSSNGLATPGNPSPKKRKGPLPFSIEQNESRSKELSPVGDTVSTTAQRSAGRHRLRLLQAVLHARAGVKMSMGAVTTCLAIACRENSVT